MAEQSDQVRPLVGISDGELEGGHGARPAQRRLWLRAVALGAAVLGVAALAQRTSQATALRGPSRPSAYVGMSAKDGAKPCNKVYIDTDVGIDDNIALVAAFGQHRQGIICIIGIGVTDGNIPAWISHNTFPRLLALFSMEDLPFSTPVVPKGKNGDMGKLYNDADGKYQPPGGRGSAEHIHGKDGMGGLGEFMSVDPKLKFPHQDKDGDPAAFLEQRLEKECSKKDCDLLVLGPLTNIVAAKKEYLAKYVNRTIWMGGSFVQPDELSRKQLQGIDYVPLSKGDYNVGLRRRGNIAPLSEFNAWAGSVPLAKFLTERHESVGFDIIPLDVTSKLMWSPALMDSFENAAGAADGKAWDSKEFRDSLMKFRANNPGINKENNQALSKEILDAFETEMAARHKSSFSYPSTRNGRVAFIRDISVKGWASTVADGQIPKKAIANLAHDVAVLAYELNGDLFTAGGVVNVSVVVEGTATDKLWKRLDKDDFMETKFKNTQWGASGAPIKNDLKGAVFEPSDPEDAPLKKDLAKKGLAKHLEIKTGKARVVNFAKFKGEPNKAESQVMDWLTSVLAEATK